MSTSKFIFLEALQDDIEIAGEDEEMDEGDSEEEEDLEEEEAIEEGDNNLSKDSTKEDDNNIATVSSPLEASAANGIKDGLDVDTKSNAKGSQGDCLFDFDIISFLNYPNCKLPRNHDTGVI